MKPYKGYLLENISRDVFISAGYGVNVPPIKTQEWKTRAVRVSDGEETFWDSEQSAMNYIDDEGDASGKERAIRGLALQIEDVTYTLAADEAQAETLKNTIKLHRDRLSEMKEELAKLQGDGK